MPNFKKDRSKFTMKGFSPFNMGTPYKKDDPVDKNWKEDQGLMADLKSFQKDLKEAKTPEEKRKIQMDIDQTRKTIDQGNNRSSQLNPNNPDRD